MHEQQVCLSDMICDNDLRLALVALDSYVFAVHVRKKALL